MRPILVNTKQKVAVLASGLAIATTGFVVSEAQATAAGDPDGQSASVTVSASPGAYTESQRSEAPS
jgi:hypothetical protein